MANLDETMKRSEHLQASVDRTAEIRDRGNVASLREWPYRENGDNYLVSEWDNHSTVIFSDGHVQENSRQIRRQFVNGKE